MEVTRNAATELVEGVLDAFGMEYQEADPEGAFKLDVWRELYIRGQVEWEEVENALQRRQEDAPFPFQYELTAFGFESGSILYRLAPVGS